MAPVRFLSKRLKFCDATEDQDIRLCGRGRPRYEDGRKMSKMAQRCDAGFFLGDGRAVMLGVGAYLAELLLLVVGELHGGSLFSHDKCLEEVEGEVEAIGGWVV
jgi:hypothetical protein